MRLYGKVKKSEHIVTACALDKKLYTFDLELKWIEFSGNDKLHEDEVFYIGDLSKKGIKPWECFQKKLDFTCPEASEKDLFSLEALVEQRDRCYYIQRVFPSKGLKERKWFELGSREIKSDLIVAINDEADAVYDSSNDKIYFKKFSVICPLFPGMEELGREASKEELTAFIGKIPIEFANGFTLDKIKSANLKRVHLYNPSNYDLKANMPKLKKYAETYGVACNKEGKFVIQSDADFKNLLWLLDERYHTSPISNNERIATAVRSISGTGKGTKKK